MRAAVPAFVATLVVASVASAAPVSTAPTGDLDQDGSLTVADLQCMILVFDRWVSASPLTADLCTSDASCPGEDRCAPVFGAGHQMCLPGCLAPAVTLGPSPLVACVDAGASSADCEGLVHKRNADLDCNGSINSVDVDFIVQLVLGLTVHNDVDGDGGARSAGVPRPLFSDGYEAGRRCGSSQV